jgi:hypothetical protein
LSGLDGEGQARGQARPARGETSAAIRRTGDESREALDPGIIVRRRSLRAVPVAAEGIYEDLRPMRFHLACVQVGKAMVAQQIGQQVLG